MKRRTGSKKVLRAMALALATAVFATSVPVTTAADSAPLPITVESEETKAVDSAVDDIESHDNPETKEDESGAADLIGKAQTAAGVADPSEGSNANDTLKQKLGNAASAINDNTENDKDVDEDLKDAKAAMQGALLKDQETNNIIQYALVFEVDENGEMKLDEDGKPIPVYETDGVDEDGNPIYKVDADGNKIQKKAEIPIVVDVPLFEVDANGEQIVDENGNPIPVYVIDGYDEDGNPIYKLDADGNKIQATTPVLKLYSELKKQTEDSADSAISNAGAAMDKNATKAQAEKAKEDAENDLSEADTNLTAANAAVDKAQEQVNDTRNLLAIAQKKQNEANAKVLEATAALERALVQKKDEKGNPVYNADGTPVYEGDVETAEKNLKEAVAEAERLEGEAETAYETYQNANLDLIVSQSNVVAEIVKNHPTDWRDSKYGYWTEANKLCNLILQYYVFANEKDVQVGNNFEVELIDSWTAGEPYPVYNVEGNETSGIKEWRVDYTSNTKKFTEVIGNGYVHDYENKGYQYDANGDLIANGGGISDGWIRSGIPGNSENTNRDNRVVVTYYVKKQVEKIGEDGNPVRDDEGNVVFEDVLDDEGKPVYEKVTKFFNYKAYGKEAGDKEGEIYIYERTYIIEDGNILVEAKPYIAEVLDTPYIAPTPESWDNGTGENAAKILVGTDGKLILGETQHSVAREEGGYYVIDTQNSEALETKTTAVTTETIPSGNVTTQKTYAAAKDEDGKDIISKTYEKTTYTVVDGPGVKTDSKTETATSKEQLKAIIESYNVDGKSVSAVKVPILAWTYSVDVDDLSWFDEFLGKVNKFFGGDGLKVEISYEAEDPDNPITHEEAGIYEITWQDFDETTTITTKQTKITSGTFGYWDGFLGLDHHQGKSRAEGALATKKTELRNAGYIVIDDECGVDLDWDSPVTKSYYYYINYYSQSQSTQTVTKEISRTKYAADTYANHTKSNPGQAFEAGTPRQNANAEYKGQKVVWQSDDAAIEDAKTADSLYTVDRALADDTFVDYVTHLNELKTQWDNYKAATETAKAALAKVTALKNKIKELQNVELSCGAAVTALENDLNKAEAALEIARGNKEKLEAKVEAAREAVNSIDLSRFNPPASDDDDDDYVDEDVVPGTPGDYAGLPGSSADVITLTPVGGYDDEGTAGGAGRGGAQDRGVAGVRVEDNNGTNKNTNPVAIKNTNDDDKDNGAKNLTKVETPEKPLAATPFKEDPVNPAIVGISIAALLAVLAGLYYEYNRRKKAKADEMKKYKKN